MGYAVYQIRNSRFGGYGVPTFCEHPDCNEEIDRGMSFACGGEPFSEVGCDLYFCGKHLIYTGFKMNGDWFPDCLCDHEDDCGCEYKEVCERCAKGEASFDYKPEHPEWIAHVLEDESWKKWRKENPQTVKEWKSITSPTKNDI